MDGPEPATVPCPCRGPLTPGFDVAFGPDLGSSKERKTYRAAEQAGRLLDLTTNHLPKFLPPLQPCLRTGTEALVTAALAWLAPA